MGFVSYARGATEFVSVVDTGNGTGTDYTSLSAWETGVQTDLTAATTLVFAGTKTGTMADNASVTGASSLATATIVHATSTQILLESISGTFQSGEQIQIDGSNYFTTSNTGDSAIAIAKCRASNEAADITAVVIDGWTTSETNHIKIWTDPTEGYRHEGKWNERKYRIEMAGTWQNAVSSYEEYTKIEGLQVGVINPTSNSGGGIKINTNNHTISSNLIRGVMGLGAPMGISAGSLSNVYIYNNTIYGFNKSSDESLGTGIYVPDSTAYVYNNTVVDCGYGIYGANSIPIAKNNIAYNNEDNYYYGFDAASTNNLSGPTQTDAPGSNPQNGVSLTFAEEANDDFHLAQSDAGAKNVGADLSADPNLPFSTDIDGSTRTGTWDIGADEAAIPVFYSVGQNTNDHKTSGSYVQDNFNRPDANPIGGNWSAITSEDPFRIVSNQMVATVTDSNGVYWNANAFDNDQYSQVTLKTAGGTYIGAMVRISSSAKTYYFFGSGATSSYVLGKYVSGSWTVINTYTETQAVNDVIKLRVVGTTLTPTLNGTDLQSFADSSISSGSPGIHTYGSTSAALDDWEGGNLGGSLIAPIMSISSGVGTFSVAQTATNMGVGDKVTYDTSTVAYISEKISTTEWKLITATGGTPVNITDSVVVSIAHPFASLSAALPSSPGGSKGASYLNTADLVTGNYQLNIPCYYDTGADTTAVDINGWTTGAANYIKVYTPNNTTTEVNQSQRHSGKWDEGRYRLENTLFGGTAIIGISEEYTRIEGLQVQVSVNGAVIGTAIKTYFDNVNSDTRISNNIIKVGSLINSPTGVIGIGRQADVIQKLSIWNNIIYDFTTGSAGHGLYVAANADYSASKTYIYNNTFYNIYIGIHTTSYANPIAINNIIKNSSDAYDGTFAAGTDYNATDGTDDIGQGSHNKISQTFTFADEANDDFHLVLEDTGARSYGVNLFTDAYLPVKDDIDGQTRGEPWDIGSDQYQGAVGNSERNLPANLESGLIGYWSFDSPDTTWTSDTTGTTDDLSSNSYDGTLTNMLKAASPIGGISGQGFNFRGQDAAADNVSITHGTAFDSVDITYSAWIKPDTISNWDAITEVTPTQDYFGLYNGQYSIWGRCGNIYLGHTIKRNQWAFVAYVISGENYSLYEDGELIASGSGCSTSTTNHGLLKIGARSDDSMGFDGVIDEVRVYSRALSIDEVIQLYKLNAGKGKPNSVLSKTAGLSSGLVGHWSFDGPDTAWTSATAGTTNDLSGNSNTGTMTNMSRSASPVFGKLGQALKFDGVNDYINLGSASSLDDIQTTGTGMSIGMWVKNNQYTYSQPMLIGKGNANYNGYWHLFLDNNDPSIRFMKDFSGSSDLSVRADYPNTYLGQFKHIVLTWDGSSSASNVHFYIDGLEVSKISSVDGDGSAVSDAALNVSMGLSVIDSTLPFNGLMDDARIYNRALSADEIADLYKTGQMKILK